MASAISTLYGMGYSLLDDESSTLECMDEDRGSDKSSPDTLRQRNVSGFDHVDRLFGIKQPGIPSQVPPGSQYAAVLAGIGLNLTAVSCFFTCGSHSHIQPK